MLRFLYFMETTYELASLHENPIRALRWRCIPHGMEMSMRSSSRMWEFRGGALVLWKCVPGTPPYVKIL